MSKATSKAIKDQVATLATSIDQNFKLIGTALSQLTQLQTYLRSMETMVAEQQAVLTKLVTGEAPPTTTEAPADTSAAKAPVGEVPVGESPATVNASDHRELLKARMMSLSKTYGDAAMKAIQNILNSRTGQPSIQAVPDDRLQTISTDLDAWETWYKNQQAQNAGA